MRPFDRQPSPMRRPPSVLVFFLGALALLGAGCRDTRESPDSGTVVPGTDGGTTPPPPPGGLSLVVESATWFEGTLLLTPRVGNGTGGDPAPLTPAFFALRTVSGLEVTGSGVSASNACDSSLAVSPGATFACALAFSVPTGQEPASVTYRAPDGRMATGAVTACSPSAPSGLCGMDAVCMAGSCVTPCGFSNPTGPCADSTATCVSGECIPRCAPTEPFGYCASGECRDGTCDTSCRNFDPFASGCDVCLNTLYDLGTCPGFRTDPCYDCSECPFFGEGLSTCACETDYCDTTCAGTARPVWDCVALNCPGCVAGSPAP